MRVSLVAALVLVLAIGHGAEAASLMKSEAPSAVEMITKIIKEMSAIVTGTTQGMVQKLKSHELTNKAQMYIEDSRAQIQPLVEHVQIEAGKLQEQVKPYFTNIEEQMKHLTDNLQAQIIPLAENFNVQIKPLADKFQTQVERLFQQVMDQTKALLPPQ
ncbi:type-4 ice-structuring protein LS-12-like [Lampris incognitus]|uniref:type-4 ice-structuring protein LS-12-like n=1 Tax=Lampris incognitus TaxID=2546036 RepID=UPI0024B516A0|nr:type-4 ice-structuring protein LS-12-like [Lampris incognitus]